jgi:hypothetical protein
MKTLRIAFVALIVQTAAAQQTVPATIQGIVLRSGTSEPVSKATVELRRAGSTDPKPQTVLTTNDGRFAFRTVPPGQYQLAVNRAGYVPALLGQRRPDGPADTITVAGGENKPDIRIILTPAATISGRITDRLGQPVANAEVSAAKVAYVPGGRRTFQRVQSTITNDLGEYRLFWLVPGQYYVSAVPIEGDRGFRFDNEGTDSLRDARMRLPATAVPVARIPTNPSAATYFPGTTDADAAAPIDLRPGMDFRGADFIAGLPRTYHIRIVAIDAASGREISGQRQINLTSVASGTGFVAPGGTGPLDYPQGLPGRYVISATAGDLSGRVNVELRDQDLEVAIPVAPAHQVAGRIRVDGPPPEREVNLAAIRVNLPLDPPIGIPPPGAAVSADGSFTLKVPSGTYRVNPVPAQQGTYLKSIRLGNTDILNNGLQIERQPEGAMEIVLGTDVSTIEGRVLDQKQEPIREVTVALVPDISVRKRTDLYRTAPTDTSGKFQLKDVAPGDYKLFAWDGVESGAWLDPIFIRSYEERGRPIRVTERSSQTVELSVLD